MKLENQVCSLDLGKRLKELGVKQESLFYWVDSNGYDAHIIPADAREDRGYKDKRPNGISAFTVAELGEMLPARFSPSVDVEYSLSIEKLGISGWRACYGYSNGTHWRSERADDEVNARAKMLIYLIENKLLTPNT